MRPTRLICLLLLAFATSTDATTHFVNAAAAPSGDGSSWSLAFADLQDALALAQAGDEIWVAEGTYKPGDGTDRTASFHLVSGVGLFGGFDGSETHRGQRDWATHPTILSGQVGVPDQINQLGDDFHHVVTANQCDASTELDGFTITRGYTQGSPFGGGGILIRGGSPVIRNCALVACMAFKRGGAVHITEAACPQFESATIENCWAGQSVGGVAIDTGCTPRFSGVDFLNNYGTHNSGAVGGRGEFVDCRFIGNESSEGPSTISGGGSFLRVLFSGNDTSGSGGGWSACAVRGQFEMTDVVFENNLTWGGYEGAGAFIGSGTLTNVRFVGNQAPGVGAMLITGPSTLTNVLIADNRGSSSSIWVGSTPPYYPYGEETPFTAPVRLINVAVLGSGFSGEIGPALHSRGQPVEIMNSIMIGDIEILRLPPDAYDDVSNATVSISHSLVEGSGGSGLGWNSDYGIDAGFNIDLPPYFVDAANGDYRLQPGSPGVDMGSNAFIPVDLLTDLAGSPRAYGVAVDMGAYELQVPNCADFEVSFGESWDGAPLQQVLDETYGQGNVDALDDYEGAHCGDAAIPYWLDSSISGWIARVVSGNGSSSEFGWYREEFRLPTIDGVDDGVIFAQGSGEGQSVMVELPIGPARLGFYLRSADGAETFFTHRQLNDGADPQCLVYDISRLRGGMPSYVLAWEDHDAGNPIGSSPHGDATDNDYQDLVVEIQAISPVPVLDLRLSAVRETHGVRLQWELPRVESIERLELMRRRDGRETTLLDLSGAELRTRHEYMDASFDAGTQRSYWLRVTTGGKIVSSEELEVETPELAQRTGMLRAQPNPFNPSTQLVFVNARAGEVTLRIHDTAGRLVRRMALGVLPAGVQSVDWDGRDDRGAGLASGVYAVNVGVGSVLKVVLVK